MRREYPVTKSLLLTFLVAGVAEKLVECSWNFAEYVLIEWNMAGKQEIPLKTRTIHRVANIMTPSGIRVEGGNRVWNLHGMRGERPIRRVCCANGAIIVEGNTHFCLARPL